MNSKLVAEKDKVVRKFVLYDYSKTVMQPSGAKDLHTFKLSKFYRLYKDVWYDFQVARDCIKRAMNDPSKISFYRGHMRFNIEVPSKLEGKTRELVETYFHLSGWELVDCGRPVIEYTTTLYMRTTSVLHHYRLNLKPIEGFQDAVPN